MGKRRKYVETATDPAVPPHDGPGRSKEGTEFMSIRKLVMVSLACGLGLAAGCDDANDAKKKCESLVATICDRVAACVEDDELPSSFSPSNFRCEQEIAEAVQCDDAVSVGKNFGRCVDDASELECTDIASDDPLPSSCTGVILVQ